jgi:hypothetical protein
MNTKPSMISMLCIVIVLVAAGAPDATAQIDGIWNHRLLVWNPPPPVPPSTTSVPEPNSALVNFTADATHLLFGWNFGAADHEVAEHLEMRVDHTTDESINNTLAPGEDNVRKHQLPHKILIPRVRGLGTNAGGDNIYVCPNETVAMEFQPWLVWNAVTGRLNFVRDDPSGGVFGFRSVSPLATVAGTGTNYRSLALTATMTQPGVRVMVCDNIWPSDAVRRYNAGTNTGADYNTSRMFLSVTLTVTDNQGGQPDDEILRIRIPYWLGSQAVDFTPNAAQGGNNQPSDFMRFQRIPDPTMPWEQIVDALNANAVVGHRKGQGVNLADNPPGFTDEFIITRAMLPPVGTEGTIEAEFVCNWTVDNPRDFPHQNHRFFFNDQNSAATGNAHNTQISHLDIEVEYSGRVDLTLRNVRLETPAARDLFWRTQDDEIVGTDARTGGAIRAYLTALRQRNQALFGALSADEAQYARVWRFYGKDEIIPCYWKSYRYLNRLLGGRLITEWGVWWPEAAQYSLNMDNFWQGNTFQPDPTVATYTIVDGLSAPTGNPPLEEQHQFLGLTRGRDDEFGRDPDLQVEGHALQTAPFTSFALPIDAGTVDALMNTNAAGIQPRLELVMHDRYWANRYILFGADTVRWLANVWNYSSMRFNTVVNGQTTTNWLTFASNGRPKTCAEYRLQLWSPLILGAKGLLLYCGENVVDPVEPPPTPPNAQLAHLRPIQIPGAAALARGDGVFEPTLLAGNVPAAMLPVTTVAARDAIIDNNVDTECGDDWITVGDVTNADEWMSPSLQGVANRLAGFPLTGPDVVPQVYIGQRTMRQVTREVALRLNTTMRDTLALLRLKGWHARSYRRYTSWAGENAPTPAASPFAGRIDISDGPDSRLSTRPPGRNSPTPGMPPGQPDPGFASWEPVDSTFLDVTILAHVDDPTMNDSFYVGVLNRRTNPLMTTGTETAPQFHPYGDLLTEWATHPERLYAQLGAREVRIPFRYTKSLGKMLRITELGAATTTTFVEAGTTRPNIPLQRPQLDTLIGADRDFVTRLLPGEGRIYKVRIREAADTTGSRGWLAHAGQRKMVFTPNFNGMVLDSEAIAPAGGGTATIRRFMRPVFGTDRRYHMVYHRRSGADETGPLSVYYRRSTLMHNVGNANTIDAVAAGDITWEQEILLSDRVRVRQTPSDTSAVVSTEHPSCGYPSIVVRFDAMDGVNKAYVVYACERGNPSNPLGQPVAICEAVLDADLPAAEQRMRYEMFYQTEILAYSSADTCGAVDVLRYWGTPSVNAAAQANFYAWSSLTTGIEVGAKHPRARFFVTTQREQVHVYPESAARYPSLNTYSRLHIGEPDAALVWQEDTLNAACDHGNFIAYTRLFYDPQTLTIRQAMTPDNTYGIMWSPQPEFAYEAGADAIILNTMVAEGHTVQHPSIYRHLSDFGTVVPPSPWVHTGEMSHKAERVVWQSARAGMFAPTPSSIERRVFDVYDRWYLAAPQVTFWTLPQSRIFSMTDDLTAPSIAQGSQDRELYSNTPPVRNWDYDDTTMTLAFSAGAHTATPRMWLSAFGWDLYGQNTDWQLTPSHIGLVSHTIQLFNYGRRPHLSARYSISQDRSTQKNRLIYEDTFGLDNPPGDYTPAPAITRTNEGLYRQALYKGDASEQTQRQSIEYAGFRSDRAEVFVSSVRLGEKDLYFHAEEDYTKKKNTDQRLVTPWVSIADMEDAALSVVTTGETERYDVDIERQSDGTRLPLNVLATNLGRAPRRQAWKLGADPTERYRFVIESRDRRAAPTVDIELVENTAPLLRSTENAITVLDLRTMRAVTATNDLRVFPQPATDKLTVVMPADSGATHARRMQVSSLLGEVISEHHVGTAPVVDIDVSTIPTGTYVLTLIEPKPTMRTMTTMRTMVRIAR